jgi:hypothetical protein
MDIPEVPGISLKNVKKKQEESLSVEKFSSIKLRGDFFYADFTDY